MSIRTPALQVNNYDQFELDRDALDPPTLKFLETCHSKLPSEKCHDNRFKITNMLKNTFL